MKPTKETLEHWLLLKDFLDSAKVLGNAHGIPFEEKTMEYLEYRENNEYLLAWDCLYELGKKYDVVNVSFWQNLALAARNMIPGDFLK